MFFYVHFVFFEVFFYVHFSQKCYSMCKKCFSMCFGFFFQKCAKMCLSEKCFSMCKKCYSMCISVHQDKGVQNGGEKCSAMYINVHFLF